MKQLLTKQKIIYIVILAIILTGIIVISTIGFNLGFMYSNNKRIDIYIGKDFEIKDIKNIAKEVINEKMLLQTAEILDDYVSITVKDINDEQVENLKTKIIEKYEISEDLQSIKTTDIPSVNVIDIIKPYVFPIILVTLMIIGYLAVRFRKQNILKICVKFLGRLIIIEALYFSIIAICRIPFDDITMPIALLIYIMSVMGIVCKIRNIII